MKKILVLIVIILGTNFTLDAQTRYSNYFITGGIDLNLNIYNSYFNQFTGIRNNSPGFESTSGLGSTFYIGGETILNKSFLGSELRYGLKLAYSDLSATYDLKEFIGNYLLEKEALEVNLNHHLEPNIKYLMIENYAVYQLIENLPLQINLGFQLGFPLSKSFKQYEELLDPVGANFPNGTKYDRNAEGEIPNFSSIYLAVTVGARYEIYKFKSFGLNAEAQYNYGLTNLVTDLNWKASSIRGGISVIYHVPLPDFIKPIDPPKPIMPEPPSPPVLATLDFDLIVKCNELELLNGDTLYFEENFNRLINYVSFPPIIFFADNSSELSKETIQTLDNLSEAIIVNPSNKLDITLSTIDESDKLLVERFKMIKNYLNGKGISDNQIDLPKYIKSKSKSEYPEILDENQYAKFNINGNMLLTSKKETYLTTSYTSQNLKIKPVIKSSNQDVRIKATLSDGKKYTSSFDQNGANYDINYKDLSPSKTIIIDAIATDNENQSKSLSKRYNLSVKKKLGHEFVNLHNNNPKAAASKFYEELILGYFDFDKAVFNYVDEFVKEYIIKSLDNGKRVFVLPLTDNFGSVEHNLDLAKKRAIAAEKLLNLGENHVMVEYPETSLFDNTKPEGRIRNRSIVVRIY